MSSSNKPPGGADERFQRVQKDPRFWEMPERERKIKIDKRFQSMFHDERFKVTSTVDKRGRPVSHTATEDLRRFYNLSDEEEEEDEAHEAPRLQTGKKKKEKEGKTERKSKQRGGQRKDEGEEPPGGVKHKGEEPPGGVKHKGEEPPGGVVAIEEDDDEEGDEGDSDTEEDGDAEEDGDKSSGSDEEESGLDSDEDSDSGPDLARGKGNVETSSDEDDEDEVDVILRKEEETIEHDWGELCKDAPRSDEVSARLAVCNMDWDRIRAKDLLALLNSFAPKGGAVLSVKIYPSALGKERLRAEERQAPLELQALPEDSEDDTEEERVYREKMRDYQFKRLKYYYAVAECDSSGTASKIYEDCDGYEYESSCSVLDLRFVPDDVAFDDEPKDVASDVNPSTYTPKLFTSAAAAMSKVQLTWDETDHERVTAMNRKFNKDDLLDLDYKAYLASSSEDEDVEQQDAEEDKQTNEGRSRKKTRTEEQIAKYRNLLKGIADGEKLQDEDKDMEMEVTWVPGLKETTEQLVKKKLEEKEKPTPWEEFLQKKKEKKKQKKTQRKETSADLSDDDLPPDVDLNDAFFKEELEASEPKKKQKKKRQEEEERTAEEEEELQRRKAEMALLMEDGADDAKHKHFNYAKIVEQQNLSKKKRKKLQKKSGEALEDDGFQVDVGDARFQAMFTSHLYNLDPSHPSYRNTNATQTILAEKQRRRNEEQRHLEDAVAAHKATPTQEEAGSAAARKTMDPGLSLLVKSIKSKTQQFQARKKQKLT